MSTPPEEPKTVAEDAPTVENGARASAPALAPGQRVGPYTLLEPLGEGGMGVVYVALHVELERKVALKLLRSDEALNPGAGSGGHLRLLREAQAMAALNHPNVVTVYEVGSWEDRVFLAMELVQGTTLRRWLNAQPRRWDEVVEAFLQAGAGLAAAHAAGLIHRDFKLDNALIDGPGRVRVADFGLARAAPAPTSTPTLAPGDSRSPLPGTLATPMTHVGMVVGTPGYMAPELLAGAPGDGRADEFGFCVALYEALYGFRPFEDQLLPGQPQPVKEPPKASRVPSFLFRVLVRGLSPAPEQRYASMNELLGALSARPDRARGRVLFAGGMVLAAVLAVVAAWHWAPNRAPAGCRAGDGKVADVWNDGARGRLSAAFAATGGPSRAVETGSVISALDAYARAWEELHEGTCRQVRAGALDETSVLTLACLREEEVEFAALVDVVSRADAEVAPHALAAVGDLAAPSRCTNGRLLTTRPRPPADPPVRHAVEALRLRLAAARAEREAGHLHPAAQALTALAAEAERVGYCPVQAEVLQTLASTYGDLGDRVSEKKTLLTAEALAEGCGADEVAAFTASSLAYATGLPGGDLAEGHRWAERAHILISRIGGDPLYEARLAQFEGAMATREGKIDQGLELVRKALSLREQSLGPTAPRTLDTVDWLTQVLIEDNRHTDALPLARRSLAAREQIQGPESPNLYSPLLYSAEAEQELGQWEASERDFRRAIQISAASAGMDSTRRAEGVSMLADLLLDEGRPAEALPLLPSAEHSMEVAVGPGSMAVAAVRTERASVLTRLGRFQESKSILDSALPQMERSFDPDDAGLVEVRLDLAEDLLGLKHPGLALPLIEQSLGALAKHATLWKDLARGHLDLARAELAAHRDKARARQLAELAAAEYDHVPWRKADVERVAEFRKSLEATSRPGRRR